MIKVCVVVLGMAVIGSTLLAAEADLSLDIASAYVFRGSTFNDGLVLQPGLSVTGTSGISIGVWGNFDIDDYDGAVEDNQFSEIDIYGSYAIPVECMDLSVGYTEYTYPSGGGDADREISVSAGKALIGIDVGAALFYGLDGGIDDSLYIELSAEKGFELAKDFSLEVGGALGYADPDNGQDGFSHFTASLGLNYAAFSAGVTYIGQIDDDVLPDVEDGGSYDVEVVGAIGAVVNF